MAVRPVTARPNPTGRRQSLPSGELHEEAFELLHGHPLTGGPCGIDGAVAQPGSHQAVAHTVESRPGGRELGDHVTAVLTLGQHALQASDLAFYPRQAPLDIVLDLFGEPHASLHWVE